MAARGEDRTPALASATPGATRAEEGRVNSLSPGSLVTIREALEIIPVSRSLLYELVAKGEIPSIRVGSRRGRILIHRADLEAFIDRSRAGGARR